jgi:chaperonin GroES
MKFKPLRNRVLLKKIEAEEKTSGGIILTEENIKIPWKGEVVAVGEGKLLDNGEHYPMSVKVGNIVLFGREAGDAIELDGEKFIIILDESILFIVED